MTTSKSWGVAVGRYRFPLLALVCIVVFVISQNLMLLGLLVFAFTLILALPAEKSEANEKLSFKYLFATGGLAIALLLAVMLLNFLMNPYGVFKHRLTPLVSPAGRDAKLELFQELDFEPQVIILGSSRSFGMSPSTIERVTGKSAFNASIENGIPIDYLAYANFMLEQDYFPEVLIVGLAVEQVSGPDRTSVSGNSDVPDAFEPYLDDYEEPSRLESFKSTFDDVYQLASYHQAQASIDLLVAEARDTAVWHYSFDPDGLGRIYLAPLPEMIASDIANDYGDTFEKLDRLAPDQLAYLEAFLQLAHDQGTKIIIYLPPYHPELLALYQEQNFPRLQAELLEYLEQWQSEYGFSLHDFSDPGSYGGTALMFYDTIHATEEANDLIIDHLASDIANS